MFDIIGVFNTMQMAVVSTQQVVLIYISTCVCQFTGPSQASLSVWVCMCMFVVDVCDIK